MTAVSLLVQLNVSGEVILSGGIIPDTVAQLIAKVVDEQDTSAAFTVVTFTVSVWSASAGIWALMKGICLSYIGRNPNYLLGRIRAFFLTIGFLAMLVLSLIIWVFGNTAAKALENYFQYVPVLLKGIRYVFTFAFLFAFILIIYRTAPGFSLSVRKNIAGAITAACGWGLVSRGYELYIRFFRGRSMLYGYAGAFLGLAVWLFLISFVILLGAELNAALNDNRLK